MIKNLIGNRYGKLTVLDYAGKKPSGKQFKTMWLCKCDCGNEKIVAGAELKSGHTSSCGCIHREMIKNLNLKHGLRQGNKRLYSVWKSMKDRCYRQANKSYKNYGGRGIKICDEWKNSFENFYNWAISNGYKDMIQSNNINLLSIDRIDNNGNYEPSNCRWANPKEQASHTSRSLPTNKKYSICPVCKKRFKQHQQNGKETCSRKCMLLLRSKRHYEKTKDNFKKECPVCHKIFEDRSGHLKKRIYCSRKCSKMFKSPIWEYNGEKHRVVEWANIIGINAHCLLHRKEMGWTINEILSIPKGEKRNVKY